MLQSGGVTSQLQMFLVEPWLGLFCVKFGYSPRDKASLWTNRTFANWPDVVVVKVIAKVDQGLFKQTVFASLYRGLVAGFI